LRSLLMDIRKAPLIFCWKLRLVCATKERGLLIEAQPPRLGKAGKWSLRQLNVLAPDVESLHLNFRSRFQMFFRGGSYFFSEN
jgi:hypothetical protein